MKNTWLLYILIIITVSGCKLDPPIYQPGTVPNPTGGNGAGNGSGTDPGIDATYTVGISGTNNFTFQIDGGEKIKVSNVASLTQDPDGPFDGVTNLSAHQESPKIDISFSTDISNVLGIYPLSRFSLTYKDLNLEAIETGTVKFTTYKDDEDGFPIVKGYFKVTAVDKNTQKSYNIVGSFIND